MVANAQHTVNLAMIALSRSAVLRMFEESGWKGGDVNADLDTSHAESRISQDRMLAIAQRHSIRIVTPTCTRTCWRA